MTPARRTAAACHLAAGISTLSAAIAATWHPWYAVPGLVGAAFLLWGAASAQDAGDRRADLHERLHDAAASDTALLNTDPDHRSAA
ncbi:hypothetical protein [Streptomyces olivaceus]|uniref:hypothetical protein n=1 Tax=Streptomyces olivaceus TaxID=47716 RepID=UPI0004C6D143|nr:hypothetical protein [Streptomyces olivaceus]MBZ6102755.1 hypothetical protein [Streptomyces olivaceus]